MCDWLTQEPEVAAAKARLSAWQSLIARLRAAAAARLPDLTTLLALHASMASSRAAPQVTHLNLGSAAHAMHALCLRASIAHVQCPAGGVPAAACKLPYIHFCVRPGSLSQGRPSTIPDLACPAGQPISYTSPALLHHPHFWSAGLLASLSTVPVCSASEMLHPSDARCVSSQVGG